MRMLGPEISSRKFRRSCVHGSPGTQPRSRNNPWTSAFLVTSRVALPSRSTPRSGSAMSSARRYASSSSRCDPGAIASRISVARSRKPMASTSASRLQVRTAAAVASAPNRHCQPRSPGWSCIGACSCCHSRRATSASPSPSTSGCPRTIAMARSHTTTSSLSTKIRLAPSGGHPRRQLSGDVAAQLRLGRYHATCRGFRWR